MVISYMGGECFKITQGDLTLVFNPPSKDSTLKASRFGSDIVLVSLHHKDFNGIEQVSFGEREPFVITGPGEYEVRDTVIRGFASDSQYGGAKGVNTLYSVFLEGINLCFLGALSSPQLSAGAKQELDGIDILFLPIGGDGVLNYAEGYKLAVQLEPKIIIPMHYDSLGESGALKHFLKEAGAEDVKPTERLTIKKKDLEDKEGEVVVLSV